MSDNSIAYALSTMPPIPDDKTHSEPNTKLTAAQLAKERSYLPDALTYTFSQSANGATNKLPLPNEPRLAYMIANALKRDGFTATIAQHDALGRYPTLDNTSIDEMTLALKKLYADVDDDYLELCEETADAVIISNVDSSEFAQAVATTLSKKDTSYNLYLDYRRRLAGRAGSLCATAIEDENEQVAIEDGKPAQWDWNLTDDEVNTYVQQTLDGK